MINLSLKNQDFPLIYKQSKIIPLLKKPKDDPLNPKFYRPVSLLPIMSKILERAVFIQIEKHIIENDHLHPCHHGNIAGCMMLDLSAAYDLASHDLILQKLELYGFEPSTINWMKSYLSGRTQCVYIESNVPITIYIKTI